MENRGGKHLAELQSIALVLLACGVCAIPVRFLRSRTIKPTPLAEYSGGRYSGCRAPTSFRQSLYRKRLIAAAYNLTPRAVLAARPGPTRTALRSSQSPRRDTPHAGRPDGHAAKTSDRPLRPGVPSREEGISIYELTVAKTGSKLVRQKRLPTVADSHQHPVPAASGGIDKPSCRPATPPSPIRVDPAARCTRRPWSTAPEFRQIRLRSRMDARRNAVRWQSAAGRRTTRSQPLRAIEQQLGLSCRPQRPVEALVIDHLARPAKTDGRPTARASRPSPLRDSNARKIRVRQQILDKVDRDRFVNTFGSVTVTPTSYVRNPPVEPFFTANLAVTVPRASSQLRSLNLRYRRPAYRHPTCRPNSHPRRTAARPVACARR